VVSRTDTVAIVTGGSTGSGRRFARALAARGDAVVLVYLDDPLGADAVIDEIVGADGTAIAVRADITDELDVERLFSEAAAAFGGVDVIVHADTRSALVVYQHAASHLRDGGAIVTVGRADAVTPFLSASLRARGITIAAASSAVECYDCEPDSTDEVALLDRPWQIQQRRGAEDDY
jgi:nucleoside-diphosphate-sugar epimerase